jgi:hypothetical protein
LIKNHSVITSKILIRKSGRKTSKSYAREFGIGKACAVSIATSIKSAQEEAPLKSARLLHLGLTRTLKGKSENRVYSFSIKNKNK